MATVVLTAVGSMFGPIGAAVGALAGQALDAAIFKPAGREGPRIADLRVQTSSYGTQIPQMFGRMRVAGTVIWATDLMEGTETSGGGKGRPDVTRYNYTVSFAVALSSRPVVGVGRIWADGNLLRGEAGDFKAGIGAFRMHGGGADQPVDPLSAADRGAGVTPAHRGLAYAVFEGLQLADFGNRIPSLTFELMADAEDGVAVTAIAAAMAGDRETPFAGSGAAPVLGGYAAAGGSAGEALQPILDGYGLMVRPVGEALVLTGAVPTERLLRVADDLAMAGGAMLAGRSVERASMESVPRRLSVRYYDPARDYQAGTQSAERQGAGWEAAQVDLPATLDAASALQRAGDMLRGRVLGRRRVLLARGWDALPLGPGDVVALEGQGGSWRVETVEWEGMAVKIGLTAVPMRPTSLPDEADGGTSVLQPDRRVSPTHVAMVETPQLHDGLVDVPQVFVAASGESAGWRGAAILLREEAGGYVSLAAARRAVAMGIAMSVLDEGTSRMFDAASTVEVQLHDADAILVPASDAALLNGANACLIGEELLQYGMASAVGMGRYRLSRLLRGRRGTEHWMQGHGVGDVFVLLDADRLVPLGDGRAVVGRPGAVAAQGMGDSTPAEATRVVDGRAMLPLSPVHLRILGDAEAGVTVRWVRRSRLGWGWADGADAPLGEEQERYRIEIWSGVRLLRSDVSPMPVWFYPPEAVVADLALAGEEVGSASFLVRVRQQGTHGPGVAAQILLSL